MKAEINKELFLAQIKEGFTIKQLQEYWDCSRTTITSRKKEWNLVGLSPNSKPRDNGDGTKLCKICGENKSLVEFYSNGYTPVGNKKLKPECKQCANSLAYIKHLEKVKICLEQQGRSYCCEICGYKRNHAALSFHHVTTEKNFQISDKSVSLEDLFHEIAICKLLCQNCHHEVHNPALMYDIGDD